MAKRTKTSNKSSSKPAHKARKRFGQNFLVDRSVTENILTHFAPSMEDDVVEIGPGHGALTGLLLGKVKKLTLVELDRDLADKLKRQLEDQVTILQADALKVNFSDIHTNRPLRIIGNLPYNISTPLLIHCLAQKTLIQDCLFMLQKEVVDRLVAEPDTKDYGRLSILAQYHCETEHLFDVPPTAFEPQPKVISSIIYIKPYKTPKYPDCDPIKLQQVVSLAFGQRRKQIRNTLAPIFDENALIEAGINPKLRAENLSVETFVQLANLMNNPLEPSLK